MEDSLGMIQPKLHIHYVFNSLATPPQILKLFSKELQPQHLTHKYTFIQKYCKHSFFVPNFNCMCFSPLQALY